MGYTDFNIHCKMRHLHSYKHPHCGVGVGGRSNSENAVLYSMKCESTKRSSLKNHLFIVS